jgi:phosphoglycolate phosphatase-like HAD superfamily hydrolase
VPHLVWDWNGTLLDDLTLVVAATNASLAAYGGSPVSAEEHRRDFRRPIIDYYSHVLGRPLDPADFVRLDRAFHQAYAEGLLGCGLSAGALDALAGWAGTQSLLSMWFHDELVPAVETYGLAGIFTRVDGLRTEVGGDLKAGHLARHLAELGVPGDQVVLIGDSLDDAAAADSVGGRAVLYTGGFTAPSRLRASEWPVADTLVEAVSIARSL